MARAWLIIAKPRDAAGVVRELRWSAGLQRPHVVSADERILSLPTLATEAMADGFGMAGSQAQPGQAVLSNADGALSAAVALAWDNAEIELYLGDDSAPPATPPAPAADWYTPRHAGRHGVVPLVTPPRGGQNGDGGGGIGSIEDMALVGRLRAAVVTAGDGVLTIGFKDPSAALDVPLDLPRFAGTGGKEGPASLANSPKPWCYGPHTAFEGVWVDRSLWIMMLHARRINNVPLVTDRGVALTRARDYDTYAEMAAADLSASSAAGTYVTCLAEGCIRLARRPTGVVVADFEGDAEGGYVYRPGELMRRILADLWTGDGLIVDTAALDALDAAWPYPLKLAATSADVRVSDWIETVAVSAGAMWWVDQLAMLTARIFDYSGTETLLEDWEALRPELLDRWPRWRRLVLGYRTIGRVHSNDELAETPDFSFNAASTLVLEPNVDITGDPKPNGGVLYGFLGREPDRSADGSFYSGAQKITVDRDQYGPGTQTFITSRAGTGFLCYEVAQTAPFTCNGQDLDCVFVRRDGSQWQYDNGTQWVDFTPSGTLVALAYLACNSTGHVVQFGLFGSALPLDLAAFPGASQNAVTSGTGAPAGGADGDLYYEIDVDGWWARIGGAWWNVSDKTASNIAGGIIGQGALATLDLVSTPEIGNHAVTDRPHSVLASDKIVEHEIANPILSLTLSSELIGEVQEIMCSAAIDFSHIAGVDGGTEVLAEIRVTDIDGHPQILPYDIIVPRAAVAYHYSTEEDLRFAVIGIHTPTATRRKYHLVVRWKDTSEGVAKANDTQMFSLAAKR